MYEYSHPIFIKGRYRVVAIGEDREFREDDIVGYAVLNAEGAKVRHELALVDAKQWMERLAEEETVEIETVEPDISKRMPPKPRRVRR